MWNWLRHWWWPKKFFPPMSKADLYKWAWRNHRLTLRPDDTFEGMITQMNHSQIEDLGRKVYGVELDRRRSKENMVSELKASLERTRRTL